MPRTSLTVIARAGLLILVIAIAPSCGDDPPTKADFVDRLREITNPPMESAVAGCTYDALAKDRRLMQRAMDNTTVSDKDSAKLSAIVAQCVIGSGGEPTTTTTSSPS